MELGQQTRRVIMDRSGTEFGKKIQYSIGFGIPGQLVANSVAKSEELICISKR